MRLATGPVSWGVDFADAPGNPPWATVLDEIQASGVDALELGPVGYLPEEPDVLRTALGFRRLTPVGSFVFEDFHDPERAADVAAVTNRTCRWIAAAGGSLVVLIDKPSLERAATAGRSADAPRLRAGAWRGLLDRIEASAAIAREHGLRPVVHPHVGGYLEFEDEVERLLDDSELDLCLDTGHAAYAGMSPDGCLSAYAPRLQHVHLKDVRPEVVGRGLDFWDAVAAGVFCPLGDGVVSVPAVVDALARAGYEGFATIEQDRLPGSGTPAEDLAKSIAIIDDGRP